MKALCIRTTTLRAISAAALAGMVTMAHPASAKPGAAGWQTAITLNVPTGQADQFVHYACPTGFTAESGGYFAVNAATLGNGFNNTGSGPRLDENPPAYNEWAWNFVWPNGGAPAGSQLIFNITCKKGNP